MVHELSKGERCVCELAALVGSEMPTVSRHLSQLKHAGIVDDEKRGRAGVLPAGHALRDEFF
jgi:ArsR family transcriptional regulator